MKILVELLQIAIALGTSGAMALLIGPTYVLVAFLVLSTCMALLYDHARTRSNIVEEPVTAAEFAELLGTSFVFGMIWPALPVILTWKIGGERDDTKSR